LTDHPADAPGDAGASLVVLGRGVTRGFPLGIDDPLVAARAVRRALAAARRRAVDVGLMVVASPTPIADDRLASFARRALGPHGATVTIRSLVADATDAGLLADQATAAAPALSGDIVLAIGLGLDGTTEARCLCRLSPGSGGIRRE
jgi:hypothetical protein